VYVLDNGFDIFIWVGANVHPELCNLIFAAPYVQIETGKTSVPILENPWSIRLHNMLGKLCEQHGNHPYIFVAKADSDIAIRMLFLSQLVEDKSMDGQMSYAQWLNFLRDKTSSSS